MVLCKVFIQSGVVSHCVWELCLFSNKSLKTGPVFCFLSFSAASRIVGGGGGAGGELRCRGTQIALVYTFLKVYKIYFMIFHSLWLGSWNFHSHGGTCRFQSVVPGPCMIREVYFSGSLSALWFTFLIYFPHLVFPSVLSQNWKKDTTHTISFFILERFTESS